jgi:hypothetical protein
VGRGPPPANNRVCRLRPLPGLRCNPSPCHVSCRARNRVAVELTLEREVVGMHNARELLLARILWAGPAYSSAAGQTPAKFWIDTVGSVLVTKNLLTRPFPAPGAVRDPFAVADHGAPTPDPAVRRSLARLRD